jgi:hypothetical protein
MTDTHTSVLSLLQSLLAVSWQWLLPREIRQLAALRPSYQLPTNWIPGWRPFHSNFLVFSSQADFQLRTELSHSPTSYFTSFHLNELMTTLCSSAGVLVIRPRGGPNRRHRLQKSSYCCHGRLPRNRLDIVSAKTCLPTVTKQRICLLSIVA